MQMNVRVIDLIEAGSPPRPPCEKDASDMRLGLPVEDDLRARLTWHSALHVGFAIVDVHVMFIFDWIM